MKKYLLMAFALTGAVFLLHRSKLKNAESVTQSIRSTHIDAPVAQSVKLVDRSLSSPTAKPPVSPTTKIGSKPVATKDMEETKKLKREIREGVQYAEDAGRALYPSGRELSRTQLPDGRTTVEYITGDNWKIKKLVLPGGRISGEQILSPEGEETNRLYDGAGYLMEVNYLTPNGNRYSVIYGENGQIRIRNARVGQSVFSTQDGSWQKLFEQ